jgi:RNA polymerase sigma-70 factor (ECF subfamily)
MNDRKLIQCIVKNPERGLAIAVENYGSVVKAICGNVLRRVGTPEDVEEACSDTFVKLWRNAGSFEERVDGDLKAFICAIARNAALDILRKRQRASVIELPSDEFADASVDVENDIITNERNQIVRAVIGELDEPSRSIFEMRFFRDLSVKSIAHELGLSPKQVENTLHRKKKVIKVALTERGITNV